MTITVQQFRSDFTEFGNQSRFPSGLIQFWLNWAYKMLNAKRFSEDLDIAVELFVAHNVSIERKAMDEALVANNAQMGSVGLGFGPITAKSVDKASVSYDTSSTVGEGASHWNLTIYGTRLWRMIKMFGAGPVQLGAAPCGPFIAWVAGIPIWWPGWWDVT